MTYTQRPWGLAKSQRKGRNITRKVGPRRLGLLFGLVVIMGMLAGTVFAGAFTFDPPVGTSVVTPSPPVWGAAGDFDEDGILDVAVTSGPPTLHIMFGNSDGQG